MRWLVFFIAFIYGAQADAQSLAPQPNPHDEKYFFLQMHFGSSRLESIRDTLERIRQSAETKGDAEFALSIKLFLFVKEDHEHVVKNDTTEYRLLELASEANTKKLSRLEADVRQALGDFYYGSYRQQLSAAIEQYTAAYSIYKTFSPSEYPDLQKNLYSIGLVLYKYQEYGQSIEYLRKAINVPQADKYKYFFPIANAIGLSYRSLKQYDSAIHYFQVICDTATQRNDEGWIGISKGNIGITFFLQKKYTEAEPLLEKDIELSIANSSIKNAVSSMAVLAKIYHEQHKDDEAQQLLSEALRKCYAKSFFGDYSLAEQLYEQLHKVYEIKGQYRLAALYADSALIAKDSATSRYNALALSRSYERQNFIKRKLAEEKVQNQAALDRAEHAKTELHQQQLFYKFAIAFLVVVLLVAGVINRFRANLRRIFTNLSDAPDIVVQKMSVVIISIATCAAAAVWAVLYYSYYGPRPVTFGPIIYLVVVGSLLFNYFLTKKQQLLINLQLVSIFIMPVAVELAGGGFQSGIVIVWSFLAPVGALLYKGIRHAAFWMILFVIAVLCTVIFKNSFSSFYFPISEAAMAMFNSMNIVGTAVIIYFSMQYFVKSIIRNERLLQEKNLVLSDTMDELNLEKQKAEKAYFVLKETHVKLVQSEKMAALGQLAAGIAHEVNTPLGAIRSSSEVAAHSFNDIMADFVWFANTLGEKDKELFVQLVAAANPNDETLSTKEERELKKKMRARFSELGIVNTHFISDRLVQVGIFEVTPELEQLANHEHFGKMVHFIINILSQKRSNKTIQIAVDKASRIVGALKTYVHATNDGLMERISVRDNIETVLTIYQNRLKQGIKVIKNYEEVPEISGYADQLNQVWTNLIVNAVHAMDGKGILTIGINQKGESVVVSIKDTGMGIPASIREKIFEPFFTTKSTGEGSGLGLDIISRILKEHSAQITFETAEGEGTTFFVELPITSQDQKNEVT